MKKNARSLYANCPQRDYSIRDAVLTAKGKEQCRTLSSAFQYHEKIDAVFASPLRRTIQTAALSFGPVLSREEVPFILLPALQEVSNIGCDVGIADTADEVQMFLPKLFPQGEVDFDINKVDASAVTAGWNSKVGRSPGLTSACMLTNTFFSKTIGRTRSAPSRSVLLISGIGYTKGPRRR
jgi:hypothetical protein